MTDRPQPFDRRSKALRHRGGQRVVRPTATIRRTPVVASVEKTAPTPAGGTLHEGLRGPEALQKFNELVDAYTDPARGYAARAFAVVDVSKRYCALSVSATKEIIANQQRQARTAHATKVTAPADRRPKPTPTAGPAPKSARDAQLEELTGYAASEAFHQLLCDEAEVDYSWRASPEIRALVEHRYPRLTAAAREHDERMARVRRGC